MPGHTYHLTHRCHNRAFLLRFARDRTVYTQLLRHHVQALPVSLLTFDVTSNHVHILVKPHAPEAASELMQRVAGDMSRIYNLRKERSGAFWEGRFHATMVEDGTHLWNCMKYIELNMVRAGVVSHPREWRWTGYSELMGMRKRYRLLDLDKVLELTGAPSMDVFQRNYAAAIDDMLSRKELKRNREWTEGIAVGSKAFLKKLRPKIQNRRSLDIERESGTAYVLREAWNC